jgi:hypothetical protein
VKLNLVFVHILHPSLNIYHPLIKNELKNDKYLKIKRVYSFFYDETGGQIPQYPFVHIYNYIVLKKKNAYMYVMHGKLTTSVRHTTA